MIENNFGLKSINAKLAEIEKLTTQLLVLTAKLQEVEAKVDRNREDLETVVNS